MPIRGHFGERPGSAALSPRFFCQASLASRLGAMAADATPDVVLDSPDLETARAWPSVAEAAAWAGLDNDERDALLNVLGARATMHPRAIAAVAAGDIEQGVTSVMSADPPPSAFLVGRNRLFVHACRVAVGGPTLPMSQSAFGPGLGSQRTRRNSWRRGPSQPLRPAA